MPIGSRRQAGPSGSVLARGAAVALDAALELTVVGSFSSIGFGARRAAWRAAGRWEPPARLDGRVAVVTGGTSGVGLAIACGLAAAGARVHVVGRDRARADGAVRDVERAGDGRRAERSLADLADPQAVRRLAAELSAGDGGVDVLVHAAGTLLRRYTTGPDGTEATVAVHVLAPFLLTESLRPSLLTAAANGEPRVVTVTSGGMYTQRFDLARLQTGPEGYDGVVAYARAKRAQVVLTEAWAKRLGPAGIACHAMHPGWADTPGLRQGLPRFARLVGPILRTPQQGADTAVWLAGTPCADHGGRLWHDRRQRSPYHLPWTRVAASTRQTDASALLRWCETRPGWAPAPPR